MELVFSAEQSRSRPALFFPTAPLRALIPVLLLLAQSIFYAQANAGSPHRCLLVVETSRSMQRRAQGVGQTVKDFLDTGLHGQLRDGDSVALWTFSDNLVTNQFQPWGGPTKIALALRVADLFQPATYERKASLEKVVNEIRFVLGQSELITVLLVCSGDDKIQGTPVDQQLNDGCKQWQSEVLKARMPVVILLRAKNGQLTDWAVSPATWPIELPPLPDTTETLVQVASAPLPIAARPPQTNAAVRVNSNESDDTNALASAALKSELEPTGVAKPPPQPETTTKLLANAAAPPVGLPPGAQLKSEPVATANDQALQTPSKSGPSNSGTKLISETLAAPPMAQPMTEAVAEDTNPAPRLSTTSIFAAQVGSTPAVPAQRPTVSPGSNISTQVTQPVVSEALPAGSSTAASGPAKTLVSSNQTFAAPPGPLKPGGPGTSTPEPHSTFVETSFWIALIIVFGLGAIYFIWAWLASYLRPRVQKRPFFEPQSATEQAKQLTPSTAPKPPEPKNHKTDINNAAQSGQRSSRKEEAA